jgi:hypothetical protein
MLPDLEVWVVEQPQRVIAHQGEWPELIRVCRYFVAHPRPGLYIRELPIDVHTKFIETHIGILRSLLDVLLPSETIAFEEATFERRYGLRMKEPLVRLRILDPSMQEKYQLIFSELAVPVSQLATLGFNGLRCLIVENEMTFLTLPSLGNTIALLGRGFAIDTLRDLGWLHHCQIMYWGDLDAQGFQILSRLRGMFPHAVSILMDQSTLNAFEQFVVSGTPCPVNVLPHLTLDEHALFEQLNGTQQRLEQEHISYSFAKAQLLSIPL